MRPSFHAAVAVVAAAAVGIAIVAESVAGTELAAAAAESAAVVDRTAAVAIVAAQRFGHARRPKSTAKPAEANLVCWLKSSALFAPSAAFSQSHLRRPVESRGGAQENCV